MLEFKLKDGRQIDATDKTLSVSRVCSPEGFKLYVNVSKNIDSVTRFTITDIDSINVNGVTTKTDFTDDINSIYKLKELII